MACFSIQSSVFNKHALKVYHSDKGEGGIIGSRGGGQIKRFAMMNNYVKTF